MAKKNIVKVVSTEPVNQKVLSPEAANTRVSERSSNNTCRGNTEDFRNLELHDMEFNEKDLSSSEFHFSKLLNVTFRKCNLNSIEFNYAELENVHFIRCEMRNAEFNFASFANVSFAENMLRNAEFDFAHGTVEFSFCHMEFSEFHNIALEVTFTSCNCERNEFLGGEGFSITAKESYFVNAEMNDTTIHGVLEDCDCSNLELKNSNCLELKFKGGSLRGVDSENAVGFNESENAGGDSDLDEKLEDIFK